jgi:hypothetical protein
MGQSVSPREARGAFGVSSAEAIAVQPRITTMVTAARFRLVTAPIGLSRNLGSIENAIRVDQPFTISP